MQKTVSRAKTSVPIKAKIVEKPAKPRTDSLVDFEHAADSSKERVLTGYGIFRGRPGGVDDFLAQKHKDIEDGLD